MDNGSDLIRGTGEVERQQRPQQREGPAPSNDGARPQREPGPALTRAGSEALSMDQVGRFFNGSVAPQGNALVGDMVDENGPLAGRESARGKRRPGTLPTQFSDDDRPMLFAPNDAPDELPPDQSQLDRLLREQEFRDRRRFTA